MQLQTRQIERPFHTDVSSCITRPYIIPQPETSCVMRSAEPQPQIEHLKVPRENRTWLRSPSEADAARLVTANAEAMSDIEIDIQGCSLSRLRRWTREDVFATAMRYTSAWHCCADTAFQASSTCWVVGGHQPTLFHPGVWAKNFAVSRLASNVGAVGLNLVVDNDTVASSSIRVPTGSFTDPRTTDIAFDSPQPKQPWENVQVQDQSLFRSFPERVREALRGWDFVPLLESFWPKVLDFQRSVPRLADAFTAARSQQEHAWHASNLELPLSQLCQLPSFLWFTCHILAQLPRFREIYNSAVSDYRRLNHIQNTSHPVPELAQQDQWMEAPFWVWRQGEQRRSRLFVQPQGTTLLLAKEGGEILAELPLNPESDAGLAVDQLRELQTRGVNIRTRALTTTLFSRICLADLFVHGIGGAKYDEITDQLISRFFGLPVPAYWIVSGTLHLPLGRHSVTQEDLTRAQRREWDLRWNPAVVLAENPEQKVQELCAEFKERLHLPTVSLQDRRARHRELNRIKTALSIWANKELPLAREQIEQTTRRLAANRILESREYSSVLYPEDLLRSFLNAEEY